jgi:hypothetical protein
VIIKAKKSTKVFKGVVVVESPAKAKALGSFL